MPWLHTGATAGAACPWLGAALAKTDRIVVGTGDTAPILCYNPAVVAQVLLRLDLCPLAGSFLGLSEVSHYEVSSGTNWP
jgi:coenzyme F420-dependent glucose-6-phosphate dehydrogenase